VKFAHTNDQRLLHFLPFLHPHPHQPQVRSRMESEAGISFTEFTYQLLQGYDFVHLAREHGVRVQVRCASCLVVVQVVGGVGTSK
jgi:hypothetical protein